MAASAYRKLLEPHHIGKVKIRNRLVKTGAGTSFIETDGQVGARIIGFYEALAKGGTGLIIVESTGVDFPLGIHHPSVQLHLEDDRFIPGYRRLTESIHRQDCPIFLQLFHSGPWHPSKWSGIQPIASSSLSKSLLPNPHLDETREITQTEIIDLVKKFADASDRAYEAGFDGVEINASSAHLINSFISRAWNMRKDEYGPQSLENRARFLVQIVAEIKKRRGDGFAVSVLLTGAECGIANGTTIDEACGIAKIVEDAGIDALQIRAYGYGKYHFIHPGPEQLLFPEPGPLPGYLDWSKGGAGAFVPLSEAVKKVVSIPVIVVGRMDPELGESVLRGGKADFIGMNRRLLADPELPHKVASGRLQDIAPCTACCYCWHTRRQNQPIRCRINSSLGREYELTTDPVQKVKKVMVIGGGPAGLEAARVAAARGHKVTLIEKERKLGGLLSLAAAIKGCAIEEIPALISYFARQLSSLGVNIVNNKTADKDYILGHNCDAVILAAGGKTIAPAITGINGNIVLQASDLHKMLRFFLRFTGANGLNRLSKIWMPIGRKVVILGSGIQGCELAEFLVKRGRAVTIVDSAEAPGSDMVPEEVKERLLDWLKEKGTIFKMNAVVREITADSLIISTETGEMEKVSAHTIIPALPLNPNTALYEALSDSMYELYTTGDCDTPGLIADAVNGAAEIARRL